MESEKKAIEEMARIKQSAISDESSEASRAISQLRKEAVELAIKKALDLSLIHISEPTRPY